jgi:hypothetical protein
VRLEDSTHISRSDYCCHKHVTPLLQGEDTRRDSCEVVGGGTGREEDRFKRSVAAGGAQVEDQISEIAVDGELKLKRPAEEKRSLSLTEQNTAAARLSKDGGNIELTAFHGCQKYTLEYREKA